MHGTHFSFQDEIYDSFARNGTFDGNRIEAPRTIKDLVIFLVWAVLLLTPLFYFLGRVVLAGSLFALITFLTFVIIGEFCPITIIIYSFE